MASACRSLATHSRGATRARPRLDAGARSTSRTVRLPIEPPLAPMLAKLTRDLPRDGYLYEPKWDGFRCLVFRDGDEIELWSRQERPLGRYFPELVEGFRSLRPDRFVLDGEIMLLGRSGFDFATLMTRLHPSASRVTRLSAENPASYV